MCPRIWCIRDKIALSVEQLFKSKNANGDLVCPFCKGEIIDSQEKEILENKTIIIRRAGSAISIGQIPSENPLHKTADWKKFLYETEKTAYP